MRKVLILAAPFLAVLLGCASAPLPKDWQQVRIIERNEEGMVYGVALPKHLEGCDYVGKVRITASTSGSSGPFTAPDLDDDLRKQAAKKGGDTVVVLPGKRVQEGALRGSVFRCAVKS